MNGMSAAWDVLVVDDEPVICECVKRVLEAQGLSVAVASDAPSALIHPAAVACRLVVCDLMLATSSGLDLLRTLKRRRPALPVVMITGYATLESAVQATQAGAAGFLPKPFDETELLTLVRHVLRTTDAARKEEPS
jgi:DNA-binding NtrC family response regulator